MSLIFKKVCEYGEVVQWMSACSSDLIEFGKDLESKGYKTLHSIAFLTEEEITANIEKETKEILVSTLAQLRRDLFRM